MTSHPAAGDAGDLLAVTRDLTRRVRLEQRGGWFPLLVFAVVTFAAIPFDRYGHRHPAHCASLRGGAYVCTSYSPLILWYWPVALVLGYLAITWYYLHRSERTGVGTRVRAYVVAGVVLAALSTGWALWANDHPGFLAQSLRLGAGTQPADVIPRLLSPAGAIGLGLLLLAWIERSWQLLFVTLGYLVLVFVTVELGRVDHPSVWAFLPHVLIDGGALLLGSLLLALTQRLPRPSA